MTQQYLAGELSFLLSQVQAADTEQLAAAEVRRLRRESETLPVAALAPVVLRALRVTDALCWGSIRRGNATSFSRQAALCAALYDFGVCAGLLPDDTATTGSG